MPFDQRFRLPDVCYLVFDVGNGIKYALGNQSRTQKAHHGEDERNDISEMPADQLRGKQGGAIQSLLVGDGSRNE